MASHFSVYQSFRGEQPTLPKVGTKFKTKLDPAPDVEGHLGSRMNQKL